MTEPLTWMDDAVVELSKLTPKQRNLRLDQMASLAVLQADPDKVVEPPPIRTVGEYLDTDIGLPPMIIGPGQIARGGVTAMISRGGKGKTTFTLNRLARWAVGKPVFDALPEVMAPVEGPVKSLIIENEGSPGFFQDRLRLLLASQGFNDEDLELARQNLLIWGEGGWPRIKLDNPDTVELVRRGVEEHGPDLVLLDTFRSLHRGEENSSTEMANLLDTITELAAGNNLGVLLIHHENKTPNEGDAMNSARGSTVLEDDVAVMERYAPIRDNQSEIRWIKTRFEQAAQPVRMEFDFDTWTYRYIPEAEGRREILDVLTRAGGQPVSVRDVADELRETVDRTKRLLRDLSEDPDLTVAEMPAVASSEGSTGKRYRVPNDQDGGLTF